MNHDAVVRFLVANRAQLLAYAWSILRDDHAAEDIYQDTFVAAIGQSESFNGQTHLLKWSRVTLRNKALGQLRARRTKAVPLAGDVLDLLEGDWEQTDALETAELTDALRNCLAKLTDNVRQLIHLRYGQGLRGNEIAQQLGRQPQTVYVALSRAYKSLGECINRRIAKGGGHA